MLYGSGIRNFMLRVSPRDWYAICIGGPVRQVAYRDLYLYHKYGKLYKNKTVNFSGAGGTPVTGVRVTPNEGADGNGHER